MMACMQLLQTLARDVRINRRRRDVRMSEQQLHDAEIGAMVQQVRCERMPKHVRRQRGAGDQICCSVERGYASMRRYVVPALSEIAILSLFFAAAIVLIAFLK